MLYQQNILKSSSTAVMPTIQAAQQRLLMRQMGNSLERKLRSRPHMRQLVLHKIIPEEAELDDHEARLWGHLDLGASGSCRAKAAARVARVSGGDMGAILECLATIRQGMDALRLARTRAVNGVRGEDQEEALEHFVRAQVCRRLSRSRKVSERVWQMPAADAADARSNVKTYLPQIRTAEALARAAAGDDRRLRPCQADGQSKTRSSVPDAPSAPPAPPPKPPCQVDQKVSVAGAAAGDATGSGSEGYQAAPYEGVLRSVKERRAAFQVEADAVARCRGAVRPALSMICQARTGITAG